MVGIRTRGGRMEGVNKSTELRTATPPLRIIFNQLKKFQLFEIPTIEKSTVEIAENTTSFKCAPSSLPRPKRFRTQKWLMGLLIVNAL